MDPKIFQQLHREGLLSGESLQKVEAVEKARLFSVHWELKILLWLGITLLSGGLGILVYKNIDTIGHQVILAAIALISAGCYFYCSRKSAPFSVSKIQSPDPFFDYILLLGCLTLITFIAYLQYAYSVFGNHFGLATFIPMVILFISAYRFDHLGVLSLSITNLAAWLGIAITPMHILRDNQFDDTRLIYTGLFLGALLLLAGFFSEKKNLKKHFEFTYSNFGAHLLFISGLAGLFTQSFYFFWFLLLAGIGYFVYLRAMKKNSFYFFVLVALYGYIALGYVVIEILVSTGMDPFAFILLYFIGSAIALVWLLIRINHKMKINDRL